MRFPMPASALHSFCFTSLLAHPTLRTAGGARALPTSIPLLHLFVLLGFGHSGYYDRRYIGTWPWYWAGVDMVDW